MLNIWPYFGVSKTVKSVDFLHPKIATLLGNLRFQTIKFIQILCFSMVAPYFFDKSHWFKGKSTGHVCFFHIHFVAKVVEMGFNESDAKRALSSTGPGGQDIEGFEWASKYDSLFQSFASKPYMIQHLWMYRQSIWLPMFEIKFWWSVSSGEPRQILCLGRI